MVVTGDYQVDIWRDSSYLCVMDKRLDSDFPFDLDLLKQIRTEEMARTFALDRPIVYGTKDRPGDVFQEYGDGSIESDPARVVEEEPCEGSLLSRDRMVAARAH